ncbi:MAG TPA: M57 family metalloprotease, partial [Chitinophagaceae bacterium]|nr:M57 family metalloprotease [Chitinophagaceae bacterium]
MKNLAIPCLLLLAACSKSIDQQHPSIINNEKETCSFGLSEFNMVKRPAINIEMSKGKPGGGGGNGSGGSGGSGNTGGGGTTTTTTANVILLDFNGEYVTNTMWNVSGPITCAPANLNAEEAGVILQRVTTDFTPFNITVTTDEAVYNAANPLKRMRVIITESWEWYGQAGGVSYLNSFTWGSNTPCFVFSSLLGYSVKMIAEACSHEAGHTIGLRHQSVYDAAGVKLSEYNWGQGSGEIGWAPIMGASYNENLSLWHYGPNSLSATTMQDDVAKIAAV